MKTSCFAVIAVLLGVVVSGAAAASDYVFEVKPMMVGKVSEFHNGGKELEDLRTYNVPNNPIYMTNVDKQAIMPLYDFLACAKLSNPKSDLDINVGGGIDLTISNVKFAHGEWPVSMVITRIDQIHLLEKNAVFILKSFTVGTTKLTDPYKQQEAMGIMIAGCLAK
ncbi:MAG: hypothetical protein ACTSV1_00530 [Alphaproteobacteria bacterium]